MERKKPMPEWQRSQRKEQPMLQDFQDDHLKDEKTAEQRHRRNKMKIEWETFVSNTGWVLY